MGGEMGQRAEWNANGEVDWWLLDAGPYHKGCSSSWQDLNQFYRQRAGACGRAITTWTAFTGSIAPTRRTACSPLCARRPDGASQVAVMLNLTPVPRHNYRIGLPRPGKWEEVLNSDAAIYGGSNVGNLGGVVAEEYKVHNQPFSAGLTLPPLGVVALRAPR